MAAIAQLDRALPCEGRGQSFESIWPHHEKTTHLGGFFDVCFSLRDDVLNRALKHGSDADQCLDRWVLVGAALELDDGVVVYLGFLGKTVAGHFMLGTKGFDFGSELGKIVLGGFGHKKVKTE